MIRSILVAFATLVAITTAGMLQAATLPDPQRPSLKSEAIINGDIVRIGDLIDHAGIVCLRANFPRARSWRHGHCCGRNRS